ncbi:hypothetical protein DL93DRAFT_2095113 [Clavulina sp. PMI_390]|nr:hypothetical protein DL93DRAFT_2095113 [Clavulina sp. PMI_390]
MHVLMLASFPLRSPDWSFKASVWSYYRSQGYADDDDDEDEDDLEGSFIRDGQGADESLAQSQHPEEDEGDSTISATDVAPQRNQPTATNAAGYRRPAMKLPLRARDSMAAVRARRGAGFGQGRGAGGRMVDETMETDDGEVTANITAMPLSGAKKR